MMTFLFGLLARSCDSTSIVPAVLWGGGVSGAALTTLMIKHLMNREAHCSREKRLYTHDYVLGSVCKERHRRTDEALERIESKLDRALEEPHAKP